MLKFDSFSLMGISSRHTFSSSSRKILNKRRKGRENGAILGEETHSNLQEESRLEIMQE
jgi:hypothetical protein